MLVEEIRRILWSKERQSASHAIACHRPLCRVINSLLSEGSRLFHGCFPDFLERRHVIAVGHHDDASLARGAKARWVVKPSSPPLCMTMRSPVLSAKNQLIPTFQSRSGIEDAGFQSTSYVSDLRNALTVQLAAIEIHLNPASHVVHVGMQIGAGGVSRLYG